jgi:hypothetical protein
MITPFTNFVRSNDYSLLTPEVGICMAILAGLGLVFGLLIAIGGTLVRVVVIAALTTLVLDVQLDWRTIGPNVGWCFAAALVVTWLLRRVAVPLAAVVLSAMLVVTIFIPVTGANRTLPIDRLLADAILDGPLLDDDTEEPPIVYIGGTKKGFVPHAMPRFAHGVARDDATLERGAISRTSRPAGGDESTRRDQDP